MKLGIAIVSYNVRDLLQTCLRSVLASLDASPDVQAQIWVVDNSSSDGSAQLVREQFPDIFLLASRENLGFAGGNNAALKAMGFGPSSLSPASEAGPERPDFAMLLNPDTEVRGDSIARLAHFLSQQPRVGAAGPQLEYADGSFQHSAFAFPGLLQLWFDFYPPRPRRLLESQLNGRYPHRLYQAGEPFPVGFALGAALMVRREAIEAVGLLDEGYFMYAEEVDWCWRMQRARWPCYCVPSAHVVHHGGASARQFREQSTRNLWLSRKRLYDHFYGPLKRRIAYAIVRLGMRTKAHSARLDARSGEIGGEDMQQRLTTYADIAAQFRQGDTPGDHASRGS